MLYRSDVVPDIDELGNALAQEVELLFDETESSSAAGGGSESILLGVDSSNG